MSDFSTFDRSCMARALQLARNGWYTARPNPRVGCVIAVVVDGVGEVVGEGYHHRAGEPHAEVNALRDAGERARGASAYVSLEPCNHQGRTGPCSQALIEAGIAEVVYAIADPHKMASGGLDTLRAAGIKVRGPLLEAEARQLNPGFIKRCATGLPRVTVKLAMSLDGRTAMASGESQWITGPAARRDVQLLRAASDAVVTGVGTVLRDDPAMTVRAPLLDRPDGEDIARHQPLRVIVDSELRTPPSAQLLQLPGPVLIATSRADFSTADSVADFSAAANCPQILPFTAPGGRVNLEALLRELARRECSEVLVEAGSELCGAFMAAGLVDQLVVYMAPKLMGSNAMPLLTLPLDAMGQSIDLKITEICAVGNDWRITAQIGK